MDGSGAHFWAGKIYKQKPEMKTQIGAFIWQCCNQRLFGFICNALPRVRVFLGKQLRQPRALHLGVEHTERQASPLSDANSLAPTRLLLAVSVPNSAFLTG